MAGTLSEYKRVPLAGGQSLIHGKLAVSNLGGGSVVETFAVDHLQVGDHIIVTPQNVTAGNLVGVFAICSTKNELRLGFDAADPVGDEIFSFIAVASV